MSARKPAATPGRPAAAARGAAAAGGAGGASGRGILSWLPLLGGLAVGAGILAFVINKLFSNSRSCCCPKLDPSKRRWPLEKKSWLPSFMSRVLK